MIFKHYVRIALVGAVVSVAAVLLFKTTDRMPVIGSIIVVVLGFCYFVRQQKLAETIPLAKTTLGFAVIPGG